MTSGVPISLNINRTCKYKKKNGKSSPPHPFLSLDRHKASSVHGSNMKR